MAVDVRGKAADVRGKAAVEETNSPAPKQESKAHHYKGFVAGVFSGIAKLTGKKKSASLERERCIY